MVIATLLSILGVSIPAFCTLHIPNHLLGEWRTSMGNIEGTFVENLNRRSCASCVGVLAVLKEEGKGLYEWCGQCMCYCMHGDLRDVAELMQEVEMCRDG